MILCYKKSLFNYHWYHFSKSGNFKLSEMVYQSFENGCRQFAISLNKDIMQGSLGVSPYYWLLITFFYYYIFLCCGIALKIELRYKFLSERCILRWIHWTIHSTLYHENKLVNSLLIISKSIGTFDYLNKLRLSIKKMVRDLVTLI